MFDNRTESHVLSRPIALVSCLLVVSACGECHETWNFDRYQ